jgi:hypothetical protein
VSYPDPQDLATSTFVTNYLAAGNFTLSSAQTTVLPQTITDASKLICREARRYFALATYDQVSNPLSGQPDKDEPDFVLARAFPLQSVVRVSTGRTSALTLANTNTANQDAYVQFTFTGDPEISVIRTGLTLTRYASGTETANSFTWTTTSPFTTVQSLADSINALNDGGGWVATVAIGMGGWKAADLYGPLTPLGVLNGAAVSLDLFTTRLSADAIMDEGVILLPILSTAGGGLGDPWLWPDSGNPMAGAESWKAQIRVITTAGWPVVPEPIQRATAELVKAYFERLEKDGTVESEQAKDWNTKLRTTWDAMPPWVKQTVAKYRAMN